MGQACHAGASLAQRYIQKMPDARADAIVLFGATGDLARKKLYPALCDVCQRDGLEMPVIGVARSEWDDAELQEYAGRAVADAEPSMSDEDLDAFTGRLQYLQGDYGDEETYTRLADLLKNAELPVITSR